MIYRESTMAAATDQDLRLYASTGDPQAFERLTHLYINLVYTFCRRQLTDAHLAEDATQAVFILLAQKGRTMRTDVILCGWLFQTARRCCANARRANQRRTRHETEAAKLRPEIVPTSTTQSLEQEEVGRVLQRAMQKLGTTDRDALLLRYFDQCSNRGVGEVLGLSEEAAKTRIVRAVQKLRSIMTREVGGISSGASVLVSGNTLTQWLDTNALIQAPASLVQSASQIAVASGAGASSIASSIAQASSHSMAWAKAPVILAATMAAAGILGVGVLLQANHAQPSSSPAQTAQVIPTTPPTLPATAPASAPADSMDRSTPIECLRTASRCFKAMDAAGLQKCVLLRDGDDMSRIIKLALRLDVEQIHVEKLTQDRFGPNVQVVRFISLTPDVVIDECVKSLKPADVRVIGDRAIVNLRISDEMITRMGLPAVTQLLAWPIYFVQDARGGWQVDPLQSIAFVAPDREGRIFCIDAKATESFFQAALAAVDEIVKGLESAQLQTPNQVQNAFDQTIWHEKNKRGVAELAEMWTFPKAFAEQFGK
jgi:RNA polymerase sigma factor (sigma-70 family)